jgi:hypothetical protein
MFFKIVNYQEMKTAEFSELQSFEGSNNIERYTNNLISGFKAENFIHVTLLVFHFEIHI